MNIDINKNNSEHHCYPFLAKDFEIFLIFSFFCIFRLLIFGVMDPHQMLTLNLFYYEFQIS